MIFNDLNNKGASSAVIVRDAEHRLNVSGGREIYVPSRLLYGVGNFLLISI